VAAWRVTTLEVFLPQNYTRGAGNGIVSVQATGRAVSKSPRPGERLGPVGCRWEMAETVETATWPWR
jgi:hypothetical protein